jgi:hypothetical protein
MKLPTSWVRLLAFAAVTILAAPAAGAWRIERVGGGGLVYRRAQILVDGAGKVHILTSVTLGLGGPTYFTNASGRWAGEDVPRFGEGDFVRSLLARAPDGSALVLSISENGNVVVDRRSGSGWTSSFPRFGGCAGRGCGRWPEPSSRRVLRRL